MHTNKCAGMFRLFKAKKQGKQLEIWKVGEQADDDWRETTFYLLKADKEALYKRVLHM